MVPNLQFLEAPERFLPVSQRAILERMLGNPRLSGEERGQFHTLFEMIAARFHFEFHKKLNSLKALYEPFDPDRDTLPLTPAPTAPADQRAELGRSFEQLLLHANFVELPREQIVACAEHQSQTGLAVEANFSDYAEMRVFYRGIRQEQRTFRPWLTPWKRSSETVHVFSRVAMLIRLAQQPDGPVFLKLFKNVVAEDLEMLLPYVRIRMRLFDQVKIGSSIVGGVATAAWKVFTAAILSPWVFLLILSGFGGAVVRGVFSFFSSKTRYMQTLAAGLYFQNLANNTGVLAHLVDIAEAEECKELLLAYYLLYAERDRDYGQEELDRRVEQWLKQEFGLELNFDVSDAVRKLHEKGLLVRRPSVRSEAASSGGTLKVYDLPSTLRRLDQVWDGYFSHHDDSSNEVDRLADGRWPPFAQPSRERQAKAG